LPSVAVSETSFRPMTLLPDGLALVIWVDGYNGDLTATDVD
jgi:hypothetical protein